VYIWNVADGCSQADLNRDFQQYGAIEYIHLAGTAPGRFCFVRFEAESSVTLAINDADNKKEYDMRRTRDPQTEEKGNLKRKREKKRNESADRQIIEALLRSPTFQRQQQQQAPEASHNMEDSSTMLVLQCNKTHLDRLLSYLKSSYSNQLVCSRPLDENGNGNNLADIEAPRLLLMESMVSVPQKPKLSFVFLSTQNSREAQRLALMLQEDVFLNNVLNSVFCVTPNVQHYSSPAPNVSIPETLIATLLQQLQDCLEQWHVEPLAPSVDSIDDAPDPKMVVRIQAFPPQLTATMSPVLLQAVNKLGLTDVDFSPKRFTHVLSIVQLGVDHYMTGLRRKPILLRNDRITATSTTTATAAAAPSISHTDGNPHVDNSNNTISRAYFKFSEALTRSSKRQLLRIQGKVALDCGASPGGWTKYLVEQGATRVYSIDPGQLDPSILDLPAVSHMTLTYQEAFPKLEQDGVKCDILVSDMCCKDMEEQLLSLLQLARQHNLFKQSESSNNSTSEDTVGASWFVITLKCTLGHSQNAYIRQVQEVVQRLEKENMVEQVEVIHLFANRSSERTVIGMIR
jgi:23S rRNA U2552 (ribose-2'-O)-methylase RlmE/FtsJ